MKMRRALLLLLLAILFAGCGGESESESLTFSGSDVFKFEPTEATVNAGETVSLTFFNRGSLDHTWTLVPTGVANIDVREGDAIGDANTGIVPGGESKTISFTAPEPGQYKFVCAVPGHAAAGMVGSFSAN